MECFRSWIGRKSVSSHLQRNICCSVFFRSRAMSVFSKSCEYAMRAVFYIARSTQEGRRVSIREIAEKIKSPEPFLAKILQKLSKEGIVQSIKGPNGGFYLNE